MRREIGFGGEDGFEVPGREGREDGGWVRMRGVVEEGWG